MLPYIFVLSMPLLFVFIDKFLNLKLKLGSKIIFFVIIVLFIGFRYKVGGDWDPYIDVYLNRIKNSTTFFDVLQMKEAGYMVLNFIAVKFNLGINFVNLVCGIVLISGIFTFLKKSSYFWLSIIILSYTIFIVGMGYTRQSVALGFVFFALSSWDKSKIKYIFYILLGALFHYPVLFMLVFYVATLKSIKIKILISFFVFAALIYVFKINTGYLISQISVYIDNEYFHSKGALIRIFISLIPSVIIIIFYKRLKEKVDFDLELWLYISLMNVVLFFLAFNFSTFADRLALYLVPVQVVGYSLLIKYLVDNIKLKKLIYFSLAIGYFSLMLLWFVFASHKDFWIPYEFGFFI